MLATALVLSVLFTAGFAVAKAPGRVSDQQRTVTVAVRYRSLTASQWAARFRRRSWQLRNAQARSRRTLATVVHGTSYGTHWLERAFLCIHSHEGAWTDPNAPFWGGLQMDSSFQNSYGSEFVRAFGTADHWPISVQITVAIRAYLSGRGFHPWPNTARMCGLL